jgi:DNA-binding NarL/FixJ family response regulator
MTRLLIVDDHATFRSFARRLLAASGFEVVGEAGTGAEAVEMAALVEPDVVLLDVRLPDTDGFQVARQLRHLVVVLVSSRSGYGDRVAACGARGFIGKAELTGEALQSLLGREDRAGGGG